MSVIELTSGALSLRVSIAGGLILGFWQGTDAEKLPLLRPASSDDADALSSACYPLVPFGNRVKANRFVYDDKTYRFTPNVPWDVHYLHGEGWQSEWSVDERKTDHLELSFAHCGGHTPYEYRAAQSFSLKDGALIMSLTVENRGERALPFGLGWHPHFPLTPETTLLAPARRFWTEVEGWLPGEATDIPTDLDFRHASTLPHRWINNGFEDWCGKAVISWPERQTALHLDADPLFRHAFVFVSDTAFDPAFTRDYFCFEPMSHLANGHNLPGFGNLKRLEPGEALSGSIRLRPKAI